MDSQSITPWYLDKNLYVTVLGMILPMLSAKLGVQLSADKIAGLVLLVVTFVSAHSWKSAVILLKELEQKALSKVTDPAPAVKP